MQLRATLYHDEVPPESWVVRVHAHEGISKLFDVSLDILCEDPDLDLEALLWSTCLVRIADRESPAARAFHGVVEEARYVAQRGQKHVYRLRLRPTLNGLSYRIRTRLFQDKSAVDIIKAVLTDAGIPADAVEWRTAGTYPVREFCMQWRESELAFIHRLLEDEGIFYFFEHDDVSHKMVITDDPAQFAPIEDPAAISFSTQEQENREAIHDIVYTRRLVYDKTSIRDWNFKTPQEVVEGEDTAGGATGSEEYGYPGWFATNDEGKRKAGNRLSESLIRMFTITGRTNCLRLLPGRKLTILDAWPGYLCGERLLLDVTHEFADNAPLGGSHGPAQETLYRAVFDSIPGDMDYRPPRITPRPRIAGKHSAVVTGPGGEEIHVDELGRIKVHFYFDRENPVDDTASFWIRAQQQNTSGSMILPRVGWEVDVGWLDGDPDRPVVLQKLYNQETMPPYEQPANKTQGSLQSSTSPGGGATNEVRLQDGNGGQEFFVHSSKDFNLLCGNDMSEDIAVDCKEEIGTELSSLVGADEVVDIGSNQSISVTGAVVHETVGSKKVHVGGNDDWGVTGGYTIKNEGSRTEDIGALMNVIANKVSETFNSSLDRTVGAAFVIASATAITDTVGGDKTETVGAAKLEIVSGAKSENITVGKILNCAAVKLKSGADIGFGALGAVAINSAGSITETVGGNFTMNGKLVRVTAGGGATIKGGGSKLLVKGSTIEIDASGFGGKGGPKLEIKGNINFKDP